MTFRFTKDGARDFSDEEIGELSVPLEEYREHLRGVIKEADHDAPEAALILPFDDVYFEQVKSVAYAYRSEDLKYVIVVGIGGSNLGTKAIYEALKRDRGVSKRKSPQLFFLETTSTSQLQEITKVLESITAPGEVLVNVVSKSGSTTETIACFEALYAHLKDRFEDDAKHRVVATTDEGSILDSRARELGCTTLYIPKRVGGRYSVFSAVGIFPLLLANIDVVGLRQGAKEAVNHCLDATVENDPAAIQATLITLSLYRGVNILNTFFFVPEFESIGKWVRQLVGESLGKRFDKKGKEVRTGITPIVSIGSTDLHSVGQLYFGGPTDKFTSFVYAPSQDDESIPQTTFLNLPIEGMKGKSFRVITEAIYEGVKKAYQDNKIPFTETLLSDRDARSVGAYLQLKMIEVMYLGEMWGIDAFDQPDVDAYKTIAKENLQKGA